MSRYHLAKQNNGRWMILRLKELGTGFPAKATVVDCDLPEEAARQRLTELRTSEVMV